MRIAARQLLNYLEKSNPTARKVSVAQLNYFKAPVNMCLVPFACVQARAYQEC